MINNWTMIGMQVEAYDYDTKQSEQLQLTNTVNTIEDIANQPVDAKTEQYCRKLNPFFDRFNDEKKLFQSYGQENSEKADLDTRVSKLEEKVKIIESAKRGLESQISKDPQLVALLNTGSVNYNPDAKGKEIFVKDESELEASSI